MRSNWTTAEVRRRCRAIGERYAQQCGPLPALPPGADPATVFATALDVGYTELAQAALIQLASTAKREEYRQYADRFLAIQEEYAL